MKYRIIAPIIFILGLLAFAVLMNHEDPPQPTTNQPAVQQPQPQQPNQQNDPFKGVKIP